MGAVSWRSYVISIQTHADKITTTSQTDARTGRHVPRSLLGQDREGATHTLLEQRPYRQFLPVVQTVPRDPPVEVEEFKDVEEEVVL